MMWDMYTPTLTPHPQPRQPPSPFQYRQVPFLCLHAIASVFLSMQHINTRILLALTSDPQPTPTLHLQSTPHPPPLPPITTALAPPFHTDNI